MPKFQVLQNLILIDIKNLVYLNFINLLIGLDSLMYFYKYIKLLESEIDFTYSFFRNQWQTILFLTNWT